MKPGYWYRRVKKLGVLLAKSAIAIWSNEPLQGENKKNKIGKVTKSGVVNMGQKYTTKRTCKRF
jgi:hypothetical protein